MAKNSNIYLLHTMCTWGIILGIELKVTEMSQHYVFNQVTGTRVKGQLRPLQVTLNGQKRTVTNLVDYEADSDLDMWDCYLDLEMQDESKYFIALACHVNMSPTIMENTYGLTEDERHEISAND